MRHLTETDTLSRDGAQRLAAELRDYWLQRGYTVKTAVEQQVRADREAYWVVRTDMVAGLPPGWRGE